MAAARVFPMGETVQTITINSSFVASPQAIIYGLGTTVEFTNNSGVAININFVPNPPGPTLFTNIANLANGASSSQLRSILRHQARAPRNPLRVNSAT